MSEIKVDIRALKEARQEEYLKQLDAVSSIEEGNKIALRASGFASFIRKNKHLVKITFSG